MLRASDVMTKDVITVVPNSSLEDVAALLSQHKVGAVPVIDFRRAVVGIICEGDLARLMSARRKLAWWRGEDVVNLTPWDTRGLTVSDVMTVPVICVTEDTPLSDISQRFDRALIKQVPVTRDNALVGIVDRSDLLRVTVDGKGEGAISLRPYGNAERAYDGAFQSMRSEAWPSVANAAR